MHTESAVEGNAVLIGNIDNARGLVVNLYLLFSVAAALVGSVYHNSVNQIVQDFRSEFLRIGVFAYIPQKLLKVVLFLLAAVNQLLYGNYLDDPETQEPFVPPIENGYYLLKDRNSQAAEKPNIMKRGSFNFDLAVYDADNRTLYYLVLDT